MGLFAPWADSFIINRNKYQNTHTNKNMIFLKIFISLTKLLLGIKPMGPCVPWDNTYLYHFKLE